MKAKEKLNAFKEEVENVSRNNYELSDEETEQISAGINNKTSLRKVCMDFVVQGQEYGEPHASN